MRPADRIRKRFARGQLVGVVLAGAASLVFWQLGSGIPLNLVPYLVVAVAASAVAALVIVQRPENAIGWILAAVGLSSGVALVTGGFVDYRAGDTEAAAWLVGVCEPVAFQLVAVFLFLFPDGRLPSRRWRFVAVPAMIAAAASLLATGLSPWPLESYQHGPAVPDGLENPLALPGAAGEVLATVQEIAFQLVNLSFPFAAASMVFRYRAAGPLQREQIKWIACAGALVVLAVITGNILDGTGTSRWSDEGSVPILLASAAMATLPIAAGIAILHHRLYDIDRIISRTLAYGLLTAALGATYFGLVVGLQAALRPLSGGSNLAIAVTTLLVAALFAPVRRRVQNTVDRRFNRRAYVAAQTVDAFSARLREETEIGMLRTQLIAVVDETVQPAHASLWLRGRIVR